MRDKSGLAMETFEMLPLPAVRDVNAQRDASVQRCAALAASEVRVVKPAGGLRSGNFIGSTAQLLQSANIL